jgi:hypothetical protein
MKFKWDRIISLATLVTSVVALILVLKKPQPVAAPQSPAAVAANAQSLQAKIDELTKPKEPGAAPVEVRLTSQEVGAALAQAAGAMIAAPTASASQSSSAASSGGVTTDLPTTLPASAEAAFASGEAEVKDYQVNFEGDIAKGQFVTQIGGKTVYVTLAGHLGAKDGYATFDPTEFKVGDLDIPISLVNDALQKKLTEQRDRLKLPNGVSDMHVENGELVMTSK